MSYEVPLFVERSKLYVVSGLPNCTLYLASINNSCVIIIGTTPRSRLSVYNVSLVWYVYCVPASGASGVIVNIDVTNEFLNTACPRCGLVLYAYASTANLYSLPYMKFVSPPFTVA